MSQQEDVVADRQWLDVIVVNWNGAEDTSQCVASLRRSQLPPRWALRIRIIDNGSLDNSADRLRALQDDQTTLVLHGRNAGFAGGNNVGIRAALDAGAAAICVLNNDTVVDRNMFAALIDALDHSTPAALAPVMRYHGSEDIWFAGARLDEAQGRFVHVQHVVTQTTYRTAGLSGCCIFAGAETWKRVGGFDERYFLIFEDSDWSYRAEDAGVQMLVVPTAWLEHKVSRSFSGPAEGVGLYYFVRNGLLFNRERLRSWRCARGFFLTFVLLPSAREIVRGDSPSRFAAARVRAVACGDFLRARFGAATPNAVAAIEKTRPRAATASRRT